MSRFMRKRILSRAVCAVAVAALFAVGAGSARASITVGGTVFDDNAFADQLVSSAGTFTTSGGTLESVLVGSNTADFAYSFDPGANVVMKFTDNFIVNGSGDDLAVFELGTPDAFDLAISVGGTTHFYATGYTGTSSGGSFVNAAKIDLSDFGVPANGTVDTIQVFSEVNQTAGTSPTFTAFGAINSEDVPEPASIAGIVAIGAIAMAKRGKRAAREGK